MTELFYDLVVDRTIGNYYIREKYNAYNKTVDEKRNPCGTFTISSLVRRGVEIKVIICMYFIPLDGSISNTLTMWISS